MTFEFATAARILFGPGTASQVASTLPPAVRRILLVTGTRPERADPVLVGFTQRGVEVEVLSHGGEPTLEAVQGGVARARALQSEAIIGVGGGSVLDLAKAIAVLTTNAGEVLDFLEVIGRAQPLMQRGLPCVAVPTTSGSGAEVTRNAVITSTQHRVKVSLRHAWVLPHAAVVDPDLTLGLPPGITAATGMDALSQLLEPLVTPRATPITTALCWEGLTRIGALERAVYEPKDRSARESMSLASLFGGLALANAGLGVIHGFAAPIGGEFDAPHGAVCAAVLPHGVAANIRALRQRDPQNLALARYTEAAGRLTGKAGAVAEDLGAWLLDLSSRLPLRPLKDYGLEPAHIPSLVQKASAASSMKANPIQLTQQELSEVLRASIG